MLELLPGGGAGYHGILWQVQKEQNSRIALQGQARPFTKTVNGKVQIACLRTSPCMAFAFGGGAIDPLLKFAKAHYIATWLKTHAHFIPIVGAVEHQAVDTGANQAAENGGWLGDLAKRDVVVWWRDGVLLGPEAIYDTCVATSTGSMSQ